MSLPARLLRIVLILTLVLNGIGSAAASMHLHAPMPAQPMHHAGMDGAQAPAAPCAEHHKGMSSGAMAAAEHAAPTAPVQHDDPRAPDCCKQGCDCACVHACASALVAALSPPPVMPHALGVAFMAPGRPAPALPHLIRPPIG
ncbi:CopL family metal-binding regulatory protein [Luteimonas aquatica]|uniref:CopL family metal-binding regulatory protein n=1 Tax=Luteimonas aquatica TaxID=450364 RepID=UPI001F568F47|nr:CopL family metal-binding regulatory protein [Luteimonas aquatica]